MLRLIQASRRVRGDLGKTRALTEASVSIQREIWRQQLLDSERYSDPRNLNRFEFSAYSQDGTDGILREILRRVGEGGRTFVEFGASDGRQNNTVFLLAQQWSGMWIDGNEALVGAARARFAGPVSEGRLGLTLGFVTAENIESLMDEGGASAEPAVMSIDLDGNDYWVWRAIRRRPRVVVIEYNAVFPPDMHWIMAYNPDHVWSRDSYFGASLASLEALGVDKGYRLVACSLAGVNAFFVREDLVDEESFSGPLDSGTLYQPERYTLVGESRHPPGFGPAELV